MTVVAPEQVVTVPYPPKSAFDQSHRAATCAGVRLVTRVLGSISGRPASPAPEPAPPPDPPPAPLDPPPPPSVGCPPPLLEVAAPAVVSDESDEPHASKLKPKQSPARVLQCCTRACWRIHGHE